MAQSKRVTSLLAFAMAAMFDKFAYADQVQYPLRLQMNSDVLTTLFHKGDQRMLEAFAGLKITLNEEEKEIKCADLKSATFSLTTQEGVDVDSYDFDLSMDDWLGFKATDLRLTGTAQFGDDKESAFTLPVTEMKLEAEFVPEDNAEVLQINPNALKPTVKDFVFEVGDLSLDDASVSDSCKEELVEGLIEGVMQMYDSIWNGDLDSLSVMPVESFLPLILIRHVGGFALEQTVSSEAIQFGFDPEMIFESVRPTPPKKKSMLKEISSEFSSMTEGEDPIMLSFILDENAINSFLLEFVLVERAFSLREVIKADPRLQDVLVQMNTSSLAVLLPQVVEEFGDGRAIDFYLSMSHSLTSNKLDGVKPTGFQMDKNGNFKFVLNMSVTLLIQKQGVRKEWEEARSIFASFTAKGKVTTNTSNKYGEKLLTVLAKSAEISQLKIYNKDDEEQDLEQMLLTSGFNVQMEALFRSIPPFEMPMKNLPSPPEVECLGIKLSDLDINFKKGYCELTCGYKKIETPANPEICDAFISALSHGPQAAKDQVDNLFGGMSAQEYIADKQKQFETEYENVVKDNKKDEGDEEQIISEEL